MGKSDLKILIAGVGQEEKERLKQEYPFAEFIEVSSRFEAFFKLKSVEENPYFRVFFDDGRGRGGSKGFTDRNAFCLLQKELHFNLQEGVTPVMEGFMGIIFFIGDRGKDQFVNRNALNNTRWAPTAEEALKQMGKGDMAFLEEKNIYYSKDELASFVMQWKNFREEKNE